MNLKILFVLLIAVVGIIFLITFHFSVKYEYDKVLNIISTSSFILLLIIVVAYPAENNCLITNAVEGQQGYEIDYSKVKAEKYKDIVIQTDSSLSETNPSTKLIVNLEDGTSVEFNRIGFDLSYLFNRILYDNEDSIRVNNNHFKNVLVREGQPYKVTGKKIYNYEKIGRDTLYVDKETYNKIYHITETKIEPKE